MRREPKPYGRRTHLLNAFELEGLIICTPERITDRRQAYELDTLAPGVIPKGHDC
jgi:hypothetical protein